MAPKSRRRVKRRSTVRKPRKAHNNQKKAAQASSQETPSHAPLGLAPSAAGSDQKLAKTGGDHDPTIESAVNINIDFSCSTPKGKRFRIPKIRTCPPAPMKKRVRDSNRSSSLQRSPISFFASPDIELFFFAHHGLSV